MELKDFTEKEQEQINQGLSTPEISDKEAAKKILALVPKEWIKRIPFFVRGHATTKTVERVAKQYPELYAVAKQQGELPDKEREELRVIMTEIFEEKMNKHKIKWTLTLKEVRSYRKPLEAVAFSFFMDMTRIVTKAIFGCRLLIGLWDYSPWELSAKMV